MAEYYLWIKAFHIMAVIAWMAALLYLPRLFVYHTETIPGSAESERFNIMERRLLRGIMTPAMLAAWILGLTLIFTGPYGTAGWLHAKLAFVLGLSGMHGIFAKFTKDFASDANKHSQRFYRLLNEVPALLMVAIVILAVVKPF